MKNTLVIYSSRYGSTKRYAQWLAEELDADLLEKSKAKLKDLMDHQNIVYGGSLHAVGISGLDLIKKNLDKLAGKKIAVFSVGCSSIKDSTVQSITKYNFPESGQPGVKLFCLRGGFDYSRLGLIDRILMGLMKRKLERMRPEDRDEDVRGMLEAFQTPVDFTDKRSIEPIVDYIRG